MSFFLFLASEAKSVELAIDWFSISEALEELSVAKVEILVVSLLDLLTLSSALSSSSTFFFLLEPFSDSSFLFLLEIVVLTGVLGDSNT